MFIYFKVEKTGRFYCGLTNDFATRIKKHNRGLNCSTKHGIPWKLIISFKCKDRAEALNLESKIKKRGIKRYLEDIEMLNG